MNTIDQKFINYFTGKSYKMESYTFHIDSVNRNLVKVKNHYQITISGFISHIISWKNSNKEHYDFLLKNYPEYLI